MTNDTHIKLSDAARRFGVRGETLKGWADDPATGCPSYFEVGRFRTFDRSELMDWWASRRVSPADDRPPSQAQGA